MESGQLNLVRFSNVRKSYALNDNVVQNLNLNIKPGEFLSLLGPSGSGKTTTLMMLAGFENPTAGEIFLRDVSLRNVPPHKRGMGVVFQNYALFPHLSVARNIAYPLQQRGVSRADIERRVARALDMIELSAAAERLPMQLSGGQQQRVALARALVFEPELVLMDEPLGALDKQLREQMQIEIKHIHEQLGITVVYVTHDQSEALTMSSRIAVFNEGCVQQIGSSTEIYERPASSFVANFIGENNRLNGVVRGTDRGGTVVTLECGDRIISKAMSNCYDGERTSISIRPERVIIFPRDEVENKFEGIVQELIYFGDHARIRIAVCGRTDFFAKLPIGAIDTSVQRGACVTVGWQAEHCRALDYVNH